MQKNNLTLRNLYNFLMIRDYPIYSTGIIGNEQKKGITLSKFWRDTLLPEFTSGKYGKMIWKNTGSRNRHTSEICNRSRQLTVYEEYMEEVTGVISEDVILRQIGLFGIFLANHQYSYKVFFIKMNALLEEFAGEDASFGTEIRQYFADSLAWVEKQEILEPEGEEFVAGWFLTFLSIHALTGDTMNSARMQALRSNPEYRIEALWKKSHQDTVKQQITFLTMKNCEICSKALSPEHFWGRESEQFALREMMRRGGHYLLSGIGGTGKTELLRQFLQYCLKNHTVEFVCAIQYENNFAESLLRGFARRQAGSFEDSFLEVMGELKHYCMHKKVLILVDNISKTTDEDPYLKALGDLTANIFATSRLDKIDGFETYRIHELDLKSCNLVFRDNYKFILEKEELLKLNAFLDNPIYRHTMTLRLLGQFAGSMSWTLDELIQKIHVEEGSVINKEEEKWLGLRKIYSQLYSKYSLKENQKGFLRIVAALPYRKYPIEFLNLYMGYMMDDASDLFVQRLSEQGWLEMSEKAVSMHPVIAESILDKPVSAGEVYQLYQAIAHCWGKLFGDFEEEDCRKRMLESEEEDFIRSSELVLDIFFKAPFAIEDQWVMLIVLSAEIVKKNFSLAPNRVKQLKETIQNAKQISDEIRIRGYLVCYDIMETDIGTLEKEIEKQKKNQTISEDSYNRLLNSTAHLLMENGEFAKAEVLLQREAENEERPDEVNRYYQLGLLSGLQMKMDESYQWSAKGIRLAEGDKKKYCEELFFLWASQAAICNGTKRLDEAADCLHQMKFYMKKNNVQQAWYYNFYKGTYSYQVGHMEDAVEYLGKAVEYAGVYYGEEQFNCAMQREDLAMAQAELKRFEEAEKNHKIALNYTTTHSGYVMEKSRILNNMAVMYLNWDKPDVALVYAKEAYAIGEKNDDLTMAEPAYNLAKCYRATGETDKELEYLNKAYPVFDRIYSDRSEKTRQAGERIEELTKK